MIRLTKDNFDSAIADGKTLVDFYTGWCGYCRVTEPVMEELSVKYAGEMNVAKVDADSEKELAERYEVTSLPTIIFFKDGTEMARKTGAYPLEVLEEMVK